MNVQTSSQRKLSSQGKKVIAAIAAAIALLLVTNWLHTPDPVPTSPQVPKLTTRTTHHVKKGEYLNMIADKHNVERVTMLYYNEEYLQNEYTEICSGLSKRYRNNAKRSGTFCNDRYPRAYGNTLIPNMILNVPDAIQAPPQINEAVINVKGKRIALVIDETGSMDDDRATVASFYSSAIREHGKEIVAIFAYAEGQVRRLDPNGSVQINPHGGVENTYQALHEADDESPDSIILITDEAGDDWPWLWTMGRPLFLPPVIATCLEPASCEENMKRLAEKTGGEYIAYTPRNRYSTRR